MSKTLAFTTKIPHHSSHSGYEQLIKYIDVDEIVEVERVNAQAFPLNWIERLLRRITCSKWYAWDGLMFEWRVFKEARKQPTTAFFLYGDTSIGWLPYVKKWLSLKLIVALHSCPDDLHEVFQKPHLLKAIDKFIVLGSNQIPFLEKNGISKESIEYIPHGVDVEWFKKGKVESVSTKFSVLMVGSWRRNFSLYQKVLYHFSDDNTVHFTMISHAHNKSHFQDFSDDELTFLSGISDEELLENYQNHDVMLLGLEDAVANNVLLEALACELPVIVEDVGAIKEYCHGLERALVFPKNDHQKAIEIITQLKIRNYLGLDDPQKEQIEQRFSWKQIGFNVQKFLE